MIIRRSVKEVLATSEGKQALKFLEKKYGKRKAKVVLREAREDQVLDERVYAWALCERIGLYE